MRRRNNCYDKMVNKFDLVIAEESEFNLTANHVYVIRDYVGSNLILVKNDLGEVREYSTEYFRFYEGESVC